MLKDCKHLSNFKKDKDKFKLAERQDSIVSGAPRGVSSVIESIR